MHGLAFIFLVLSTFLTIGLVFYYLRFGKCTKSSEGFADAITKSPKMGAKQRIDKASADVSNVLVDLMSNVKRISGYLTDRNVWSERLQMATMNPTELARKHLRELELRKGAIKFENKK